MREAPAGEAQLPISITISTVAGWPDVRDVVLAAAVSARRAGGELIVTDGSGHPAPDATELGAGVRWLAHPGLTVYQLRMRGYAAVRGALAAITNDHAIVPPDWAERHVAAHGEHPEAVAIGGSVENGATGSRLDWASFLVTQSAAAAPIPSGSGRRLSGAVNVSYKVAAITGMDDHGGLGAMDSLHQRELQEADAVVLNDDSIRVRNVRSVGFRGTTAIHFAAGRTISSFRRTNLRPVDVARIVGAPFVPLARYAATVWRLAPRGYGPQLVRCSPWILWLLSAQGLGQLVGYLVGPGRRPATHPRGR